LLAAALVAPAVQAQTDHRGPYLVVAAGRSHFNYDFGIYFSCNSARTTTGKALGGYRFGVFAAEVWLADFGRADVGDAFRGRSTCACARWVPVRPGTCTLANRGRA
jgi:hypothetical protein